MNNLYLSLMLVLIVALSGCAGLRDVPKTLWGSSTRVLEDQRKNALTRTYEKGYWDCFKAAVKTLTKKKYVIFKKDEVRGYMVIMGIPGAVNTTEVGVFFVELNDHQTRIELSSLSTHAKRLLAKGLFHGMDIVFGLVPPDMEDGFNAVEFKDGKTPADLVKAIDQDGLTIALDIDPLEALNALLVDPDFYDHWINKHRNDTVTPEITDLVNLQGRSLAETRDLNRRLLEQTFPTVCPKLNAPAAAEKKPSVPEKK